MQSLETALRDDEKFVETVCFSGKEGDSQTKSRLRLNKQMKTKTFQSLPPDKIRSRCCKQLSVFTIKFITGQE